MRGARQRSKGSGGRTGDEVSAGPSEAQPKTKVKRRFSWPCGERCGRRRLSLQSAKKRVARLC